MHVIMCVCKSYKHNILLKESLLKVNKIIHVSQLCSINSLILFEKPINYIMLYMTIM